MNRIAIVLWTACILTMASAGIALLVEDQPLALIVPGGVIFLRLLPRRFLLRRSWRSAGPPDKMAVIARGRLLSQRRVFPRRTVALAHRQLV
jgi:hypothetical protein